MSTLAAVSHLPLVLSEIASFLNLRDVLRNFLRISRNFRLTLITDQQELTHADFTCFCSVTASDNNVFAVLSRYRNTISHLNLSFCIKFTARGLLQAADLCLPLKSLQLEGVFSCALDDGLKALSRNSPNVAVLNLSGCAQISGDCLTDLFTKWHHLTTVNLACLPQLSDRQLRTLVDLCPSVTNVTLDSNTLNGPVLSYAVNRIGARLEYLSMQYCRAVNDDVFKDVLRSCPNLRHLDVHACHSITDFGVLNAATPLSRLSTINLSLCTLLTERSVLLLMRLSPNLQRLSLFRSNGATNNILLFISQNYPSFLYLDVQGCANISLPALQSLRQSCSLLELCSSFKEVCRFRPINPDEVVAMEL